MDKNQELLKAIQLAHKKGVAVSEIALACGLSEDETLVLLEEPIMEREETRGRKSTFQDIEEEKFQKIYKLYNEKTPILRIEKETGISMLKVRKILGIYQFKKSKKEKKAIVKEPKKKKTVKKIKGKYYEGDLTLINYEKIYSPNPTVRLCYADGSSRMDASKRSQTGNLDYIIRANGRKFLEQNDVEKLTGKDREYYLAVEDFFSKTHEENIILLEKYFTKDNTTETSKKVQSFQNYSYYNNYIRLSKKEREELNQFVNECAQKEKEMEKLEQDPCLYDYAFVMKNRRSKEYDYQKIMQYLEVERKKYYYTNKNLEQLDKNKLPDFQNEDYVFTLKNQVFDLRFEEDTFKYLKFVTNLHESKTRMEEKMEIGNYDNSRATIEDARDPRFHQLMNWCQEYLKNGSNEFYRAVIKKNLIYLDGVEKLRKSQVEYMVTRLKTIYELVKEENKRNQNPLFYSHYLMLRKKR